MTRGLTLGLLLGVGFWYLDLASGERRVLASLPTLVVVFGAIAATGGLVESGLRRIGTHGATATLTTGLAGLLLAWIGMSVFGTNLPFAIGRVNLAYAAAIACLAFARTWEKNAPDRIARRRAIALGLWAAILGWAWTFPERLAAPEPTSFAISATAMGLLCAAACSYAPAFRTRALLAIAIAGAAVAPLVHGAVQKPFPGAFDAAAGRPPVGSHTTDASSRPNLIAIVWDTVRRDHLSLYGYHRETTPHLDRTAGERVVYSRATSVAPWTLPAHASMFTGLYPHEHGMHGPGRQATAAEHDRLHVASDALDTLAEKLHDAGYATGAVSANTAFAGSASNLDQGFDRFVDADNPDYLKTGFALHDALLARSIERLPAAFGHAHGLPFASAEQVTDWALAWLDAQPGDRPLFLFLNYMDAHEPRRPPSDLSDRFRDAAPASALTAEIDAYDRAIVHLDRELARFEAGLRARGLLERSVVVLTSDHGEFLGDHGLMGHGEHLYAGNIDIPLAVRFPSGRPAGSDDARIENREIFALLLEAAGATQASPRPRQVFAEHYGTAVRPTRRAVLFGDHKLIAEDAGRGAELYDLSDDPGELDDRAARDPARLAEGQGLLDDFLADAATPARHQPSQREPTRAERERLEALGYLE